LVERIALDKRIPHQLATSEEPEHEAASIIESVPDNVQAST
jgi:hypothetical protein